MQTGHKHDIKLRTLTLNANQQFNMVVNYPEMLVYGGGNLVHIFNKSTRKTEGVIKTGTNGLVSCLARLNDDRVLFGTDTGIIGVISLSSKSIIAQTKAFEGTSIQFVTGIELEQVEDGSKQKRVTKGTSSAYNILLFAASFGELKLFGASTTKDSESLNFELKNSLNFETNFIETIGLGLLHGRLLTFIACCDFNVHIYQVDQLTINSEGFTYLNSLAGHENKVKSLAIREEANELWVATAGLDNYIRIWKTKNTNEILSKNSYHIFESVTIELESVLLGHIEPVTDIKWNGEILFSSSMDCSVLVWREINEAWTNISRLGQVNGNKNAYFGVDITPAGDDIVAYTYTGALYRWIKLDTPVIDDQIVEEIEWRPVSLTSGHWKPVTDINWGSTGTYLFSCSQDQTTRVLVDRGDIWFEASRAQIHGYDINTVAPLPIANGVCDVLVCGADEKIIRLLEPPSHFVNIHNIFNPRAQLHLFYPDSEKEKEVLECENPVVYKCQQEGGQEVLGLMVKAQKTERQNFYFDDPEEGDAGVETSSGNRSSGYDYMQFLKKLATGSKACEFDPPGEDFLVSSTLWPELNKLYGHGYEIAAIVSSKDGKVLVSTCKSQSKEHSSLIFWDLQNYKVKYTQSLHNYTVLDMKFAGDYLITVSRDRNIGLWAKDGEVFKPVFTRQGHNKVIYSVSSGLGDSQNFFVTGSRDKTIKLWQIESNNEFKEVAKVNAGVAITAVEFVRSDLVIAGTEEGGLLVFKVDVHGKTIEFNTKVSDWMSHAKTVNKIRRNEKAPGIQFATCSDDHTVRIFEIESSN